MTKSKTFALRQATFLFVVKCVVFLAVLWFVGWEKLPISPWILVVGIAVWSAHSGWEMYKDWKEHFERRKQWED